MLRIIMLLAIVAIAVAIQSGELTAGNPWLDLPKR